MREFWSKGFDRLEALLEAQGKDDNGKETP